jgi:hypothetical protein
MPSTVTFSVTTMPRSGSEGSFREIVRNLRTDELEDFFLTVFHVGDSYAILSGEAIHSPHTATNDALRTYLLHQLAGNSLGVDFDVRIDRDSEAARSRS